MTSEKINLDITIESKLDSQSKKFAIQNSIRIMIDITSFYTHETKNITERYFE